MMENMSKGQKRLLVLLVIVLAYAVFDIASNWDTYKGYYTGKKKVAVTPQKSRLNGAKKTNEKRTDHYDKDWRSDPFYVSVRVKNAPKPKRRHVVRLRLKAISFAGENSVAMINNRIVSVGDVIQGYKVVQIKQKQVVLRKGTQTKILSLK